MIFYWTESHFSQHTHLSCSGSPQWYPISASIPTCPFQGHPNGIPFQPAYPSVLFRVISMISHFSQHTHLSCSGSSQWYPISAGIPICPVQGHLNDIPFQPAYPSLLFKVISMISHFSQHTHLSCSRSSQWYPISASIPICPVQDHHNEICQRFLRDHRCDLSNQFVHITSQFSVRLKQQLVYSIKIQLLYLCRLSMQETLYFIN